MKRILVTGGAGFIGSSLAERLLSNQDNYVVAVDDLTTGSMEKVPHFTEKNGRFIKCDVNDYRDIADVMLSFHFDFVFHYAAVVGVQRTLTNPVKVLDDIEGIRHILNLSKNTGVKRMFFASSSEVYGEPVDMPQNEHTTPLNSRLPYAVVKNVGEAFIRSYKQEYGLDHTIFRFFNTYGPKQTTDFVMSRFIRLALDNQDITIYGDGLQSRTFCYVDDNVDATVVAFERNEFVNDVVNIGNDQETTIIDLAREVIRITNSKSGIVHLPPLLEGDMTRRKPDITKMKKLLGRPMMPLEEGIKKVIASGNFR